MKVTSLRYLDAEFHHPSPKIKEIPKNTNGRLAIPALAGLLVHTLLYLTRMIHPLEPLEFFTQNFNTNCPESLGY